MGYKRETNVSEMYLVIELQIGYFISLNGRQRYTSPKILAALEKQWKLAIAQKSRAGSSNKTSQ